MALPVFKPAQIKQPLKRFAVQFVAYDHDAKERFVVAEFEIKAVDWNAAHCAVSIMTNEHGWCVQITEVEGAE